MSYFGATYLQVTEALQGMDVENPAEPERYGDQEKIEERMEWVKNHILGWTTGDVHAALTQGRFTCHKLIDTARNPAQTAVDKGQDFPGTVDQATYRQKLDTPLTTTEEGDTDYTFTDNTISISSITQRGQTVYADYDVDPDTITCPYLAGLLVRMTALMIGQGAVFGGSGDDGGLTDRADEANTEIYTELNDLKNNTSVSSLFKLNLCKPVGASNPGYAIVGVCG